MAAPTAPRRPKTITAGVIAEELNVPLHRVLHVLRTRKHIVPIAWTGILRVYERAAIAMVRHELHASEARRHARKTDDNSDAGSLFDRRQQ